MLGIVQYVYEHDHPCTREGQQHVVRPQCIDGVAYVQAPVCVEANTELRLIEREAI